ncbi:prephenate dehydratase [Deinococcus maricopensis]|uniref:prephenate dehydratase n=1 Tax=Deinococcus maricopensis (strain DSM 21211 / LMG 22137 / NRRL B-23946 / LB-34) TaxID=709986 RepID=E8U9B6_DEIML|nr:prephenate dehydratase [Deinococcus maricopensis]ADV67655.1 Prephenate dehydratase [Deinococcus maricopensis DSM 21211]
MTDPLAPSTVTVAYQGNPGAYSEMAALQAHPHAQPLPHATFHEVLAAVREGHADLGVLPVENSLMGAILQAMDLLVDTDLHVTGEVIVRVSHHLLALPGVPVEDVRRVLSQQPALDQCTGFIERHRLVPVAAHDTAGSAKDLAERGARDEAVIASARAGEIYGLASIAAAIEDEPFNYTRFLVLSRQEPAPSDAPHKTSLVFAVRHTPGFLLETLNELRGLNLSRIESRPRKDRAWSYLIYIDIEGSARDPQVALALAGVLRKASFAKIIGSYPRAQAPYDPSSA